MTEQADKYRQAATNMNRLAELDEEEQEAKDGIEEQLDVNFDDSIANMFFSPHIMSEHEEITKLSASLSVNASIARKQLDTFPKEYTFQGESIPDSIRKLRKSRRALKGSYRDEMSKAIDTLIEAYADHLQKCIKSITWLNDYTVPLSKMRYNEKDLSKLNKMKSVELRRETIDSLCKYWEAELKQEGMAYSKEYSELHKEMRLAKKGFRGAIAKITDQSITKTKKQRLEGEILKSVCDNPKGISAKNIHEILPTDLHKISSPNTVSKSLKKLEVVRSHGLYFKFSSDIKKNLWAYTAAFIDSDGYITLDRNMNPRVGLIATGTRGRAFMEEMHKSIGFGRMHLDQKSPQQTRLIQRLNFYSQDDVTNLLTKCLPHFRLKKGNAKLLLELIRMKKGYKKTDWYKPRCDEIFKLMKWENHKDHVGYDWLKEGIYLTDITKLQKNCKMSTMDGLENHESILKSKMAVMMTQKNEMMDRMQNPTMRVEEEENVNQNVATIDMDMDIEEDCCSQLKRKLIEEDIRIVDFISEPYENWKHFANATDDASYYLNSREEYDESFAEHINGWDCDRLVRVYGDSRILSEEIREIIEEYDLCQTSSMGEDFNTKNAMLKAIKELGIDEDSVMEEIEKQLLSWLNSKVGFVQGYTWYEITADGKKRNWLNPMTDNDVI